MKGHEIKKAAELFEISLASAIRMRIRYLCLIAPEWDDYMAEKTDTIPPESAMDILFEIVDLRRYETNSTKAQRLGEVTDEMIQSARDTPIDSVVEFVRGGIACPFHEDKHPSAYHGTRSNRLVCPVCNETWDAIEVLIKRDGMDFITAVRSLQ